MSCSGGRGRGRRRDSTRRRLDPYGNYSPADHLPMLVLLHQGDRTLNLILDRSKEA